MKYETTKEQRLEAAREDIAAEERGFYILPNGTRVNFPTDDYRECRYFILADAPDIRADGTKETVYRIADSDSFEALRIVADPIRTAVMNFASATCPGGGFLHGSRAQEECLCRMSTLYASLTSPEAAPYYRNNEACRTKLRFESLLYSPIVYVFRNPDLTYLPAPVRTQVVTVAAPNLGGRAHGVGEEDLRRYFKSSIRMMCSYLAGKADTLVLGAWGCGAFRNDPNLVAHCFREVLVDEGYGRSFAEILFAIPNAHSTNYDTFQRVLSGVAKEVQM